MRIADIKAVPVQMASSWLSDGLIANPMSIYPQYRDKRSRWYGSMTTAVVMIETDEGLRGLGTVGGGKARVAPAIIEDQFKTLLVGRNPFEVELIWEQLYRASQFYGRRGVVIDVISGIDIALWDLLGKALGQPVFNLIGGRTKEKIPAYVTGNLTERHLKEGFTSVKLAIPHGPADGKEGLRKNAEMVRKTRELIGPDGDIMLDCYMALDVPYAVALANAVREFKVLWIEEPVPQRRQGIQGALD